MSKGHIVWRACASASRSITSRSGGAYRTPSGPMRPIAEVALEAAPVRGSPAPAGEGAPPAADPRCACRPSPRRRDDGREVVVLDDEAEPTRPQLDARPRCPLVGPDRPGEDVDHAEVALDRGRRGRVDSSTPPRPVRDPPASPARPGPRRATGRRPRRSAGTSTTARRRGPRRPGGPARRTAGTRRGGAPPPSCRFPAPLGRPSRRRGDGGSRRPARPGSWPPRPACVRSAARRAPPTARPRRRGDRPASLAAPTSNTSSSRPTSSPSRQRKWRRRTTPIGSWGNAR